MKKSQKTVLRFAPILASILILIMLFLPVIVAKEPDGSILDSINGLKVAFGHTEKIGLGITFNIQMNAFAFIGFVLPFVVTIIALLTNYTSKGKLTNLVRLLFLGAFAVTAVAFFTILSTKMSLLGGLTSFSEVGNHRLGIGSILGAIIAILGFASVSLDLLTTK